MVKTPCRGYAFTKTRLFQHVSVGALMAGAMMVGGCVSTQKLETSLLSDGVPYAGEVAPTVAAPAPSPWVEKLQARAQEKQKVEEKAEVPLSSPRPGVTFAEKVVSRRKSMLESLMAPLIPGDDNAEKVASKEEETAESPKALEETQSVVAEKTEYAVQSSFAEKAAAAIAVRKSNETQETVHADVEPLPAEPVLPEDMEIAETDSSAPDQPVPAVEEKAEENRVSSDLDQIVPLDKGNEAAGGMIASNWVQKLRMAAGRKVDVVTEKQLTEGIRVAAVPPEPVEESAPGQEMAAAKPVAPTPVAEMETPPPVVATAVPVTESLKGPSSWAERVAALAIRQQQTMAAVEEEIPSVVVEEPAPVVVAAVEEEIPSVVVEEPAPVVVAAVEEDVPAVVVEDPAPVVVAAVEEEIPAVVVEEPAPVVVAAVEEEIPAVVVEEPAPVVVAAVEEELSPVTAAANAAKKGADKVVLVDTGIPEVLAVSKPIVPSPELPEVLATPEPIRATPALPEVMVASSKPVVAAKPSAVAAPKAKKGGSLLFGAAPEIPAEPGTPLFFLSHGEKVKAALKAEGKRDMEMAEGYPSLGSVPEAPKALSEREILLRDMMKTDHEEGLDMISQATLPQLEIAPAQDEIAAAPVVDVPAANVVVNVPVVIEESPVSIHEPTAEMSDVLEKAAKAARVDGVVYNDPDMPRALKDYTSGDTSVSLLSGVVRFDYSSSEIVSDYSRVLADVARIQRDTGGYLRVVGHASRKVDAPDALKEMMVNFSLSIDRANAVAAELIKLGVPANHIFVGAKGQSEPANLPGGDETEEDSRRTEIFLDY